jgi:predicted metal-dependent hydrolase
MPTPQIPTPVPTPRSPDVDLGRVPRRWLADSAAATGLANAVNLLFPIGERFFVRSVKHYLDRIADDPELVARVRGFFGQEGRHASAHDDFNQILREQGYEIDAFLAWYERDSSTLRGAGGPKLRLAATAAAEHFTAIMAEAALSGDDHLLDKMDPAMRELLGWHAAEEIEHKSVAFDVLQRVDPSYRLRMAGLAIATLSLGRYWFRAARMLWKQDGMTTLGALRALRGLPDRRPILQSVFLRGVREYMRRDFHPDDNDNYRLARDWFASHASNEAA